MTYYDVTDLAELPPLQTGFRYFDFIGGTKELRCFLASEDMPRSRFIEEHETLFDDCLKPIYTNSGIIVKQDASYALPGFYIVSLSEHFRSLDAIDEVTSLRLFFILREIRKGMRERLGIEHAHVYYEEKSVASQNVHFWILPINDIEKYPRLYNFDVKKYLEQFRYSANKETILQYNRTMKEFIADTRLSERDSELLSLLDRSMPKYKAPKTVDFNVNGACNLNCTWCWGPDHEATEDLTIEEWQRVAYRLKRLGTTNITFTGGEPLLKKGLGDILQYIHEELQMRITLSTNGIIVKPLARQILPYVDDIGLPLDGHTREINNLMRAGIPHHFDKVLESIKFVQTHFPSIDVTVRTVVASKNSASVPRIGQTMIDYGIDPAKIRWKLYQITPMGIRKADILDGDWLLQPNLFEEIIAEVRSRYPQFAQVCALTTDMHVGRYFHIYPDGKTHVFHTGPDGYPTACPLGNIRTEFDLVISKLHEFDLMNNTMR